MEPSVSIEDQPDLRLVGSDGEGETPEPSEARGHGDLVADVIESTGLLPPDKVELVRHRAAGGSFAEALVGEGFANSLGVARSLAEQYHLPLVDLAVAGVDAEAVKTLALPVLEQVCAIPFAADGST